MNYVIDYKHLKDELVANEDDLYVFNTVVNNANKYKLELSDKDFKRLFTIQYMDEDTNWIIHKMSCYKLGLVDALISYINY